MRVPPARMVLHGTAIGAKALRSILPSRPFPETIVHSEMLVVSALAAERYPAGSCAARHLARLIPNFHAGQSAEHS